jgi:iron complex transport system substrate-binding protein
VHKHVLTVLAVFALVVAACSSDTASDPTTTTTEAASQFPVTIEADNGPVTIDKMPERIVSMSATSTEVLFAIGAGDAVVAVDSQSNHPPGVPTTDLSAFQPNVEAIATYEPDLVFISYDPGDLVAGLEAIGITVIVHGTAFSLDAAFSQWEQTGAATGHLAESFALVADTTSRLDEATEQISDTGADLSYYYELDDTYYTVTSGSFIGQVLAPTGLVNIADQAPDPDGFGFPQLSNEYIVDADPDLILLADTKCCGQNGETVTARPGWDSMSAVPAGVVELDDDVASRWGPRIADLLEEVVAAVLALETADA